MTKSYIIEDGDFVQITDKKLNSTIKAVKPLLNALADLQFDIGSLSNMANTLEVSSVVAAWGKDYDLEELRQTINTIQI
jgi:hypothetical protein